MTISSLSLERIETFAPPERTTCRESLAGPPWVRIGNPFG